MNALAERLVAARKARGITQEVATVHVGLSRPTFIAIEKGNRRPKPEELISLAALYQTTVNELLREGPAPPKIAPHLRSFIESDKDDGALQEAISKLTSFVDDYQFLEATVGSHGTISAPDRIGKHHGSIASFAEHCANEERKRLGLGSHEPISFLRQTLEDVGVHIFMDGLDSRLAGLYAFVEGFGYCILINRKHPRDRRRWTIAHEYGHFLFDRDRPGVDFIQPMQRKPENERFADAFAENFLMPKEGVNRRFYDILERNNDVNVGDVCRMSDHYGVSLMAMTLRLESIGLIPKESWDAIKDAGVRVKDIRKEAGLQEPEEASLQDSEGADSVDMFPDRYRILAVQAWTTDLITTGMFAKLLRRSPIEARELAQKLSLRVDDRNGDSEVFNVRLDGSIFSQRESAPA